MDQVWVGLYTHKHYYCLLSFLTFMILHSTSETLSPKTISTWGSITFSSLFKWIRNPSKMDNQYIYGMVHQSYNSVRYGMTQKPSKDNGMKRGFQDVIHNAASYGLFFFSVLVHEGNCVFWWCSHKYENHNMRYQTQGAFVCYVLRANA